MQRVSLQQLRAPHTITAKYRTDIWRTPTVNDYNGPIKYTVADFSRFRSARVTVSGDWKVQFDQGGLFIALPNDSSERSSSSPDEKKGEEHAGPDTLATAKWIKAGIEFFNDKPYTSTVVTDNYSDWSLAPIPSSTSSASFPPSSSYSSSSSSSSVTLQFEREVVDEKSTSTLWVYILDPSDGSRVPCREISWLFNEKPANDQMYIGTYAAKVKAGSGDAPLDVSFTGFELEMTNGDK